MIKGKNLFIFKSYLLKTQRKKSYLYKTILQFRLCSSLNDHVLLFLNLLSILLPLNVTCKTCIYFILMSSLSCNV